MKSYRKELWFEVPTRRAFINITAEVQQCIDESGISEGLVLCNAIAVLVHRQLAELPHPFVGVGGDLVDQPHVGHQGEVVAHIASDNVAGGMLAGEFLVKQINAKGNVVELEGIAGSSAAIDRGKGFNEVIAKNSGIKVVSKQTANFNRAEGLSVFENILQAQPDIAGVFAHNDEMILGAIQAAQAAGRNKDIVFVGFDAVDDAVNAVKAGDLQATVAQQPAVIGELGVKSAVDYLGGKKVEATAGRG